MAAWMVLTAGIWVPSVWLGREGGALCAEDTTRARAHLFRSKKEFRGTGWVLECLEECG